jgi:hypothetical protein
VWATVVGEGTDQMTVQPKISELPASGGGAAQIDTDNARRVIVLIGPDLHRYALIYGSLRNALHRYVRGIQATGEGQERSRNLKRGLIGHILSPNGCRPSVSNASQHRMHMELTQRSPYGSWSGGGSTTQDCAATKLRVQICSSSAREPPCGNISS